MGILHQIQAQNGEPQSQGMSVQEQEDSMQEQQGGDMAQMYNVLMDNSMRAIADVAESRLREKGAVEGRDDLVATAMVANLQAANQNGRAIPPQVLLKVGKDIALHLLQQMGVPPEQLDDVLLDVLLRALEKFGDMSKGLLSPEEEKQYVQMIEQINQAAMDMADQQNYQQEPSQNQQMSGGL